VQSFQDKALEWMNRSHLAKLSTEAIQLLKSSGFDNINADIIFGIPVLDDAAFHEDLEKLLTFDLPHISAYALTVEPKTPLEKLIRLKQSPQTDDELQMRQFLYLIAALERKGYEQYEISNFSKPGCRSRHNSSYWTGEKYLGLGPSAHSFDGNNKRSFNIANNEIYMREIMEGKLPAETEILSPTQQINEAIMISLRRKEGLDLDLLEQKFGSEKTNMLKKHSTLYLQSGEMKQEGTKLVLTSSGKLRADGIAADLFF